MGPGSRGRQAIADPVIIFFIVVLRNIGTDEKIEDKGEVDDDSEVFHCPCKNCSLESYLEDGCPKSNIDSFPYLDISKLDEDDKEDFDAIAFPRYF